MISDSPTLVKLERVRYLRDLRVRAAAAVDVFAKLGYTPEPPQQAFHDAAEFDVGYGGRAGGGKTKALLLDAMKHAMAHPGFRAVGFRRTFPEIQESFGKELAAVDYARSLGAAYNETKHEVRFPNGSVIAFRYAETVKDASRVVGGAMQLCMIDERQLIHQELVDWLRSRIRSERGVPVVGIRSAFNPGDIGHGWLKARYVDGTNMGHHTYPELVDGKRTGVWVRFIPAPPTKHLPPEYWSQTLAGITDPWLRRALQSGDWDVAPGTSFPEWRRAVHVVEPEELPVPLGTGVVRGLGVDYGVANPFCALWGAVLGDGLVVVYREAYETGLTPTEQAELIRSMEAPGERDRNRPLPGWLDPSAFAAYPDAKRPADKAGAPPRSIAADYQAAGVAVRKAYNDRLAGKRLVHDALRVRHAGHGPDGDCTLHCAPRLVVYSTCANLVRTLPFLPRSPNNPEDVDTNAEDHAYDALRYLLAGLKGRTPLGRAGSVRPAGPAATAGLSRSSF